MKKAFTLTEVLISVAIVGAIAALVMPHLVLTMQNELMDRGYKRNQLAIKTALDIMPVTENTDFSKTTMYLEEEPDDYDASSGAFMRKYLKIGRMCTTRPSECFADKYVQYDNTNRRSDYTPSFTGSCATLKSGASICLKPQIGEEPVSGIIDVNGRKGPNVLGRDLRILDFDIQQSFSNANDTPATEAPLGETPPVLSKCEKKGWELFEGACYTNLSSVSQSDARAACASVGMTLEPDCQKVKAKLDAQGTNHDLTYSCYTYWTNDQEGVAACCSISDGKLTGLRGPDRKNQTLNYIMCK